MTTLQDRLLDQLMASNLSPWEASLYRTRLFTGSEDGDLVEAWVKRSHASNRERSGVFHGDGARPAARTSEGLETSTLKSISQAHAGLEERRLWTRRRVTCRGAVDGAGTPYETKLCTDERRAWTPEVSIARKAIKTLSLRCSPLGPERELALCRIWYLMPASGDLAATRQEWAEWLGVSVKSAVRYLRDIEAAGVGLTVRVEPPVQGSRANLHVVTLELPDATALRLPTGAVRHEQAIRTSRSWVAQAEHPKPMKDEPDPTGALVVEADDQDDLPPGW